MKLIHTTIALLALAAACCPKNETLAISEGEELLKSPSGELSLHFGLSGNGTPVYSLEAYGKTILKPSRLGFERAGWRLHGELENRFSRRYDSPEDFRSGFSILEVSRDSLDSVWATVWGEEDSVRCCYNELAVTLEKPSIRMIVRFRLFDDGLGFRYEFPAQSMQHHFNLSEELTEFALSGDHTAFWIPGDYDTEEYDYSTSRISEIPGIIARGVSDNASTTLAGPSAVQTSLQLRTDDSLYINIHEAALEDYPAMQLEVDTKGLVLRTLLTPDAEGFRGRIQVPGKTPWRSVMVCRSGVEVLSSRLVLNLNEPCALEDVSWIHPSKYVGVWWEMQTGTGSWEYTAEAPTVRIGETDFSILKSNGRHSANTENVRRYIDFAADNGFDEVLVEGWNIGWEDWVDSNKDERFDYVTPYPDFDLPKLNEYAHSRGVRLMMHHETGGSVSNYERHLEDALDLMVKYGYDAVKTGYVFDIVPFGEHHYSQSIINHYNHVLREAASRKLMVNGHEAVRPTGLCRKYPNLVGNEAARGNEFKECLTPDHVTILPFTRLQGGPMDFTPGVLEIIRDWDGRQLFHTTLCKQLALYVTMYSPIQMAADFPENYDKLQDAFQFIKDVAVDWDKSIYLEAEPGDMIVVARHPRPSSLNSAAENLAKVPGAKKDALSSAAKFVYALPEKATASSLRGAKPRDVWFVGGVTDENEREVSLKLDFLKEGLEYEAVLYSDAADADPDTNPEAYRIVKSIVRCSDSLSIRMASSGGFALSLREIR